MSQLSEQAHSKWLKVIGDTNIGVRQVVELVEAIFHIEDMYQLSRANSFLALNFFQLINNIGYCITLFLSRTNQDISPAGGIGTLAEGNYTLSGGGASSFPNTVQGLMMAISHCFQIQANKMDAMITTDLVSAWMSATGAAQIASDAVNACLNGLGAPAVRQALPSPGGVEKSAKNVGSQ